MSRFITMDLQLTSLLTLTWTMCLLSGGTADDHTRLLVLEREFFNWRLSDRPEMASGMGSYRNSDRLEHFTVTMMDKRLNKAKDFLQDLQSINRENLSSRDQMDFAILRDMLRTYVDGYQWSKWNYLNPLSWLEGNQRDPAFFVDSTPFDNRGDFENYLVRLNEMPRLFNDYRDLFNEAIKLGRTYHNVSVNRVPQQIDFILQHDIEDSVYYSPFMYDLDHFNDSIPVKDRQSIKTRGRAAVSRLYNAYRRLKNYMELIYMPQTRRGLGLESVDGGKEYYKSCLKWYLSLDMTPEEVHALGRREVDRVAKEMRDIMERQGFGGYEIRSYFAELNKMPGVMLQEESEILAHYEENIERIEPILNTLFRDRPGLPIKVESMPSDGPRGQYISGTSDGTRPGTFYANTFRPQPTYAMMTLAMHESNPGHHLQASYAMTADLADFRILEVSEKFRVPFAIPSYTAYMEGWALYAESLGLENHLYKDEYELMGYYDSEIFRACRLVVDTGIHYFGWSRQEAVQYFRNHTSESQEGVEVEIDRYITWPGHATAYKIGELKIKELRATAQRELGQYFDVRDFHMVILKNGYVPLHVLETEVLDWVKNHKRGQEFESEDCECPTANVGKSRCQRSISNRKSNSEISQPADSLNSSCLLKSSSLITNWCLAIYCISCLMFSWL